MKFALKKPFSLSSLRIAGALAVAATAVTSPVPSFAQEESSEARLRKMEAEIRALQRNVFPGGDGRFFEPQISGDGTAAASPSRTTTPSTTAVTDILARLDAMEQQLQRLTALTEENSNALSLMEGRVSALEVGVKITSPASQRTGSGENNANLVAILDDDGAGLVQTAPAATGPSAERLAAVQEITKPQTDDAADDEYSYGFRLWNAGFYPEARQQLSSFVETYPSHWRLTWGRNLLGRAFLDDGMPEEAARWFLRNYQADRTAARAPDSLLLLAESMIAMKDTRRACIALAEFGETYPAIASGRLLDSYEANRRKVTCEG
ncbi:tetratricopeptide repeat protein [Erythrobacter insulae]|uniref:Tetratricopeptide repeat protein n=1 Tax=Erythrobacter insulae TaxID=2584124 RepID=A0A547P9Y0_9SPHN|nr:tetratricopeptide repeat protein [Erythrobacter insulae]TRD10844.1 tetratricopeptide repeat protein [Erythrobacter insulae]